ncbi:uncharacterized protein LOC135955390 [Calliphora vicina]|uniref:uncharacterized protein LOC135955390 n=1 Tax=Calliphora vicina TaxID=7373 RepID=UPI00325B78DD
MSSTNQQNNAQAPYDLRAAYEVQQDLAVACALHSEIVWDVIGPDQSDILIKKLECMFPYDNKVYTSKKDLRKSKQHNARIKEVRNKLFRNIWQQRKYTNGALLHSIIYIIVTPELDLDKAKYTHNYTIHPIFRTRRCLNANGSAGCCMIFIDEQSRIYQNWKDFVNNNELPVGTMISPIHGNYTLDNDNKVVLEYSLTPAYSNKTLSSIDNFIAAASVVGQAATMFHPVFAILAIGTKTYETIRDYQKMSNKVERGTATNINANLNLTGNIISLTSSVATFGAYMTVPKGNELSFTASISIQAINGATTLINCTKLIMTTYDLFTRYFLDEEELDFNDLLAFGSSLILFTSSLNNIVITSQIGKVGGNTLRSLLQSNIKAGLTLLSGEVIKQAGQNAGNFDLLRLVNDIPYKEVLCNIHKIYTNLTQSGFLATLSVLGAGTMEVVPGLLVQVVNKEISEFNLAELSKHYGLKFVQHISNSNNLLDVLNGMGVYFSATVVQFLLNQTRSFIETTVDAIDSQQSTFITTEMILYKMFSYTIKNYKNHTYEFLDMKRNDIMLGVTNFFKSLNPKPTTENANKYNCGICGGYYYLVDI